MSGRRPSLGPRRRPVAVRWQLWPEARPDDVASVALPCQWQTVPRFAREEGPFVYAASFAPPPWRRVHLVAEGVFQRAEWRLNDVLLGVHRGGWDEARYDLTHLLAGENRLEARVACPPERAGGRRHVLGVFGGWDCLPESYRPGGVWRPVYLEAAGDARIASLWLVTERLDATRAEVVVHARFECRRPTALNLSVRLRPPRSRGAGGALLRLPLDLEAGTSHIALPLTLEQPLPWQPWSRSGQVVADLYDLSLVATPRQGDGAAARRSARVGLRTLAQDAAGRLFVNGTPLFVKGWNYGPSTAHLAQARAPLLAADVQAARERGLDALRVHAHVDHPALYDRADRAGLLLFQDGPLQWAHAPEAFPDAAVALRALVERLSAHPSVVALTAHNEPLDIGSAGAEAGHESLRRRLSAVAGTFLWSDNRDVWDRTLTAAVADRGRPRRAGQGAMLFFPHSDVLARHPGEDTHFYAGWYPQFGPLRTLDILLRRLPGVARWLSEFGAQSLPVLTTAATFVPERPTATDWSVLARERMAQPALLERNVGIAGLDRNTLVERTQAYQAALHGAYIDRLRAHRLAPVAGFFGFFWADAADGITWSLQDSARRPKRAYLALRDQLQPLAAVALLPLGAPRGGDRRPYAVPLVVLNDSLWRARVEVQVEIAGTVRQIATVEAMPESVTALDHLILSAGELRQEADLTLHWRVETLSGEGPAPGDGSRVYSLPSPLWR